MPLSPDVKRRFIQFHGYNPDEYDYNEESGLISPIVKTQPTNDPETTPRPETSSITGAALRGAAQNVIPTLAGGAAAGGSLLIPGVASNPISGIGVPLAASTAGALGTSVLQQKYAPQSIQEKFFLRPQDVEQHPIASFLGELAPLALTGNPLTGIRGLPKLASGARKIASASARDLGAALPARGLTQAAFERLPSYTPKAISPDEINALKTAAIGVGSNLGLDLGQQLTSDQPYSPLRTAGAIGSGLLFNEPTRLGRFLLGIKPEVTGPRVTARPLTLPPTRAQEILARENLGAVPSEPSGLAAGIRSITREPEITGRENLEGGVRLPTAKQAAGIAGVEERARAQAEVRRTKALEKEIKANEEAKTEQLKQQTAIEAERARELELQSRELANANAERERLLKTPVPKPDITEASGLPPVKGKVPEGGPEGMSARYSEEAVPFTPEEKEVSYQRTLTRAKELARQRGFELQERPVEGIPSPTRPGKTAQGVLLGRTVTTGKIGERAGGVIPHEAVGHGVVGDYIYSGRAKDHDLALGAIRKMKGGEEAVYRYKQKMRYAKDDATKASIKEELLSSSAAEELAKTVEREGYTRLKAKEGIREDSVTKFLRDLGDKFGRGTPESVSRRILARAEFDAPYGARTELKGGVRRGAPAFSEHSALDYDRMIPDEFTREVVAKRPLTVEATRLGEEAKGDATQVDNLKSLAARHADLAKNQLAADDFTNGAASAYKAQLFREAHEYATETGSIGQGLKKGTIQRYATETGKEQEGNIGEYRGTIPRPTSPEDVGEIRGGKSAEDRRSDSLRQGAKEDYGEGLGGKYSEESALEKGEGPEFEPEYKKIFKLRYDSGFDEKKPWQVYHKNRDFPLEIFRTKQEASDYLTKYLKNHPEYLKKNIEEQLGEATYKATAKHLEAIKEGKQHNKLEAERLGEEVSNEPTTKEFETAEEVGKKADEYAAFTRPDVARHSESSALTREELDEPNLGPKVLRFMEADLDMHRRKGGPYAKGADALDEMLNVSRSYLAKYEPEFVKTLKGLGKEDSTTLQDILQKEFETDSNLRDTVSPKLQSAYDSLRGILSRSREDQVAANQPIELENGDKVLPDVESRYFPQILDRNVIDTLNSSKGSPEYNALRQDYIEWQMDHGLSEDAAKIKFKDIEQQYGGTSQKTDFAPLRKEDKIGLPPSWREKDLRLTLSRYFNRFAKDRAWFDTIEADPELNQIFGNERDSWGKKYAGAAPDFNIMSDQSFRKTTQLATGWQDFSRQNRFDALTQPVSAAALGTMTGIGDAVSASTGMFKYADIKHIPELLGSWKNIISDFKGIYNRAMSTGNIRDNAIKTYEMLESTGKFEDKMRELAGLLYKVSGRDALEKFSRTITQAYGETIAHIKLREAAAGDVASQKFLSKLANNRDYTKLSIPELGTRLSQLQQGTYDIRQLPAGAIESNVAPFLRFARWNIGQTNEFFKNVVNPAKGGNFAPMLNTLFGSLVGGMLIRELRERATGKKDIVPSFKEIEASSNPDPYHKAGLKFYNLSGAAAYAGFGGIIGDLVKSTLDITHGNQPQGFTYPTVEIMANISAKVPQMAKAILDGEDIAKVSTKFTEDLAKQHFQVLRLALAQAKRVAPESSMAREQESTEARNTLRRFKTVEGEKVPSLSRSLFESNPYEGLGAREFKKERDVGMAASMLPNLIQTAIDRADGDPYRLASELEKLRRNSYQTAPNPDRNPLEFAKYIRFLGKTKSPEEVANIVHDYWRQNQVNKIKASMVPKVKP